jgi:hypothetical protein
MIDETVIKTLMRRIEILEKRISFLLTSETSGGGTPMSEITFTPDCDGTETAVIVTLSSTAWTALTPRVSIPNTTKRIIITAPAGVVRYRLNADPDTAITGTSSTGCSMDAGEKRIITIADGTGRTLGLRSSLASAVIKLEFVS